VTLAEIVYVLKGVYHWPAHKITLALMRVLALDHVLMPDKSRYQLALKLMLGPAPHCGDACCCAAAIFDCGGLLYSFDRDLSRVPEIDRREEPVA
jgi:predicted nucleic acid-binding protein